MVLRPRGRGRVGRRRHLRRNDPLQAPGGRASSPRRRPLRRAAPLQRRWAVPSFRPRSATGSILARPSLASLPGMHLSRTALAGAGATAAAAAVVLPPRRAPAPPRPPPRIAPLRREPTRRATERFAAAALETLLNAVDANDPETGA